MGRFFLVRFTWPIMLVLLFALDARAGDPKLEFRTIETEHFNIHYHQGLEDVARRAATIVEEVHLDLTILFEWQVDGPTHIVITDFTDSANGSSSAMFQPIIRLYATAPTSSSSLQYNDNYLRTLFTHEYTHMISLRIHSGFARVINAVFGTVYLPNTISPRWYHEGIAVLNETYQTTGGRIRTPYFRMIVRAAILEGTFPSLGEVSNDGRVYPRGTGHYVFGAMFMNYLRDRYGIDKIVELYHVIGGALIPYGLNRAFKNVFGTDLVTLWHQFFLITKTETESLKALLEKQGLTRSTRITFDGETKGVPIFSPDNKTVLMSAWSGPEKSSIYRVPIDGRPASQLVLSDSSSTLSMDRSGRLFYTRKAPFEIHYRYQDVFALDHLDAEPRRVTYGARSWDAAISPRGDLLVMTANEAATSKLLLADEQGNVLRELIQPDPMNQVYEPSWSPDGKSVVAVVRRGPQVDLAIIDIETGKETLVTDDISIENTPVFHPDGKHLFYKSSLNGVDNIYAQNLETGDVFQVTNVLTGAYSPAISHDGRTLAFIQYSSIGYDLHVMPLELESLEPTTDVEAGYGTMRPLPAPSKAESKPYNPLPSFAPHYWNVTTLFDVTGGIVVETSTALYDATERHIAGAVVDYFVQDSIFSGSVAYAYHGLGPGLHIGASRVGSPKQTGYTYNGDQQSWIQEITRGNINLSIPFPGVDRSHNFSLGYNVTHAQPREEPLASTDPSGDIPDVPNQYFRAGMSLDWSFSNTVSSPLGISPHKGRRIASGISFYHPYLGGNQTVAHFSYGWVEYIPIPWFEHHVFAWRLGGHVYISDPPGQSSISTGGYGEQNIVDVILNQSEVGLPGLRGYPTGAFEGNRYHSLRLEYRLPIWFVEAAYNTLPLYLKRVQAGIFSDNALISMDPLDTDDWRSSVGAELVWHIALQYFQPLTLRTGYAYGLMEGGGHEVIVTFGQGF